MLNFINFCTIMIWFKILQFLNPFIKQKRLLLNDIETFNIKYSNKIKLKVFTSNV